jgi:hypothetical protein
MHTQRQIARLLNASTYVHNYALNHLRLIFCKLACTLDRTHNGRLLKHTLIWTHD